MPGFFRHCPRHSGGNAIAKSYTFTVLRNTSRPRNRLNAQPPRTVEDGGEDDEVEDRTEEWGERSLGPSSVASTAYELLHTVLARPAIPH